jgi:hypothetical protein
VPPFLLWFCAFASSTSPLWSSSAFPFFSAASKAFMVGHRPGESYESIRWNLLNPQKNGSNYTHIPPMRKEKLPVPSVQWTGDKRREWIQLGTR